jgi:N-acetylglutamate synthase-like GNAT family acetyltransferase
MGRVDLGFYGGDVYLDRLRVRVKRRGHGTKLVKLALDHARELGIKQVLLYSLPTEEAQAFWETFDLHGDGDTLHKLIIH